MDLLTGQNKANFKAWYANWQEQNDYYKAFHKFPFAMQEGVLKAYYRSIGWSVYSIDLLLDKHLCMVGNIEKIVPVGYYLTQEEAMKQGFKAANELINQTKTP